MFPKLFLYFNFIIYVSAYNFFDNLRAFKTNAKFVNNIDSKSIINVFLSAYIISSSPFASLASDGKILNEVWSIVNENFIDTKFNKHDWNQVKEDYNKRINLGADEIELTKNMLGIHHISPFSFLFFSFLCFSFLFFSFLFLFYFFSYKILKIAFIFVLHYFFWVTHFSCTHNDYERYVRR